MVYNTKKKKEYKPDLDRPRMITGIPKPHRLHRRRVSPKGMMIGGLLITVLSLLLWLV